MATTVFRICQEALTNVARHAEATKVTVTLSMDERAFEAVVADNGKGMPPPGEYRPRSLGVVGMRERARQFGGSVDLTDAPGGGALVRVRFPLPDDQPSAEENTSQSPG